jgi:hypothetical protein
LEAAEIIFTDRPISFAWKLFELFLLSKILEMDQIVATNISLAPSVGAQINKREIIGNRQFAPPPSLHLYSELVLIRINMVVIKQN